MHNLLFCLLLTCVLAAKKNPASQVMEKFLQLADS